MGFSLSVRQYQFSALITFPQQYVNLIKLDRDLGAKEPLPLEYLPAFKSLWEDAGVKQAITRGNEYALHDNLT